jgi:prevent-host-death family protein
VGRDDRVGVRELRQNLSVYLRRVAAGETLTVTEHRRPVAVLAPLPQTDSPLERLIVAGSATRPDGDLLELEPLVLPLRLTGEQAIADERGERLG